MLYEVITILTTSFVPEKLAGAEAWINGFDDRRLLWPNYKEGIKVLNKWYNDGLIWKDFPLYPIGDKTEDNLMKAGYVGAFIHNWDVITSYSIHYTKLYEMNRLIEYTVFSGLVIIWFFAG